jgi:acetyl-CoA carboxylase carboxyltransferase component
VPDSVGAADAREQFANRYVAAECGYVDAVIQPSDTRRRIIAAHEMLDGKRDKNSPPKARKTPIISALFPGNLSEAGIGRCISCFL